MSLITQCPACSTMFKVVPDQLRISDGWVRCGQCDEVFDANVHLFSEPHPEPLIEESPPPAAITSPDPAWAASLKFAEDEEHSPSMVDEPDGVEEPPPQAALEPRRDEVLPEPLSNLPQDDFLSQSPASLAHGSAEELGAISPGEDALISASAQGPEVSTPRYVQADALPHEHSASAEHISFMRSRSAGTLWQRTSIRVMLALCALLASVGLVLQIAVHERDRWAAMEPDIQPALSTVCEWVSCVISPLRNIEALVIDSSSFTKVRTDVYRLNVAIKNNGPVPLAPPALELTLTDMQDQGLVRRVFTPKEAGFNHATLAAGAEFSVVLPIAVKTGDSPERVSGYRLLAFYP